MIKMRKNIIAALSALTLVINTSVTTYSLENRTLNNLEVVQDRQLKDIVYLTNGQGAAGIGQGTANNPYQNIKTALNNVKVGGTIKILGAFKYWEYEETSKLLHRPLIIDKAVTIEGQSRWTEFIVRAPIQLGADVTFKNLNMQFWASNELMPGVPDSGFEQNAIDEGTNFRSGRTIYLAGNKLTLDNVDTRILVTSHQSVYRPYISGGTFIEGGKVGPKSVLNIINPNDGTELAGVYAGDYWVERNLPVELNLNCKVIDKEIHAGGIMNSFTGDVAVNVYNKAVINSINTNKFKGNIDINLKEGASISDADFSGVRNLTLESGSEVTPKKNSKFSVNNLTIRSNSLLDLRNVSGDAKVTGKFVGESNSNIVAGSLFLNEGKVLDISGNVEGTTILNYYRNQSIPVKENATYIKAKQNATGTFKLNGNYYANYVLEKNENNQLRTTWTVVRNKSVFKELRWNGGNNVILKPEQYKEYLFPYEFIDANGQTYIPSGDDWDDITMTVTNYDGQIYDIDDYFDGTLDIYNNIYESAISVSTYDANFKGIITLNISHKSGKSISKKVYIGVEKPADPVVDIAAVASRYNLQKGEEGYEEVYDLNKDNIIDLYDLVIAGRNVE